MKNEDHMKQLLVIDVGNSNITFGLFRGDYITHQWRTQTNKSKTSDEYGIELEQILVHFNYDRNIIKDIIIGSVVPNLMHTLDAMCKRFVHKEPYIVGEGTKTGMHIRLDNPKEVGADRIVNGIAAYEKYGGPLIIVDIGTAITLDTVSENGVYLGGAIAPGISISSEALFMQTSKLPKVELIKPASAIGKNTVEAIQSGIVIGFIGLIDRLVEEISAELMVHEKKPMVIATGGYSSLMALNSKYVDVIDKDLTLHGLRLVYERTLKGKQ